MITEDSVAEDLLALLTEEGDFVGVIDDTGAALQVMYEPRRESSGSRSQIHHAAVRMASIFHLLKP